MNQSVKLALVDDSDDYRKIVAAYLKQLKNIEVCISAANGMEFIAALKHQTPHLVLLDLEMPLMDGYETIEYLAKANSLIKILVLTVHSDEEISQKLIQLGANGFLTKDGNLNKVGDAIHTVINHQYYFAGWDLKKIMSVKSNAAEIKKLPAHIRFTERELQVLRFICKQHTNRQIADKLFISKRTVDGHRDNLLKKTGAKNKAGLALYAQKYGLIKKRARKSTAKQKG